MGKNNIKINRKAKRKDLWFAYVMIIALSCLIVIFILYALDSIPLISGLNIAAVSSASIATIALLWQISTIIVGRKVLAKLELSISTTKDLTTINATIQNIGSKSIYPAKVWLYIGEGRLLGDRYVFETLTEHPRNCKNKDEFFCHLAHHYRNHPGNLDKAKDREIPPPPCASQEKCFAKTYRRCILLRGLSDFSMEHIMPGETFSEDVIMKNLRPGVYRVILYYSDRNWKDCVCRSHSFLV